jgi:[protein-PII] uridylyltransferase
MTSPDAFTRLHLATHVAPLHAAAWRGDGGLTQARALADAHDLLLRARFDETARRTPAPARVALVALGGYGRGALAPGSDLDLVLLTDADPVALQGFAESLLLPLWDARVSLGHAVRAVHELADLARDDLRTATSVLDARPLAGDLAFARASLAHLRAAALGDVDGFLTRLGDEMTARHARYGGSVYLLEPEVKHTRGGLRDLDLARWALDARWGARGFDDAARRHVLGDDERARFDAATEFVWRLRGAMHRRPGHRADRLTFDEQEECAARLGLVDPARRANPETRDAAVVEGASALMSRWYRHARDVATLVEQVLDLARAPRTARAEGPRLEDVAPEIARVDDLLCLAQRDSLRRDPCAALRLLEESLARGLALAPSSRAAVLAASRDARWCEALRGDPRTGPAFLRLLTHSAAASLRAPGQRAVSSSAQNPRSVLAVVHDLGLLLAMIPEFEAVTARVQHDVYHVYTVDVHSVAAVDRLHALARGEHADALPLATARLADLDRVRPAVPRDAPARRRQGPRGPPRPRGRRHGPCHRARASASATTTPTRSRGSCSSTSRSTTSPRAATSATRRPPPSWPTSARPVAPRRALPPHRRRPLHHLAHRDDGVEGPRARRALRARRRGPPGPPRG